MRQEEMRSVGTDRLRRIQARLADENLDWVYLAAGPNMTFATGYAASVPAAPLAKVRLTGVLIPAQGEACVVGTPLVDAEIRAATWIEQVVAVSGNDTHFGTLQRMIADAGSAGGVRIGIDEKLMWGIARRLQAHLPSGSELVDVTQVFSDLRLVKDAGEIDLLRRASRIADAAIAKALSTIEPGKTEIDVANAIVLGVLEEGGVCTVSQVVAGAGRYPENPSSKRIERGDVITLDVNAVYGGYYSDETRVAVVGTADEEQRRVHQTVLRANEAARARVGPGVPGEQVHAAGVAVIEENGYGRYFTHGIGHGVGLEGHEAPYLARGSGDVLRTGMVHTIEPAIYGRDIGKFSVRLEDVVLVTEEGCELLTTHTHDLVEI